MKLIFNGWRREVHVHNHKLIRVEKGWDGDFNPMNVPSQIDWNTSTLAFAKITDTALSGDFLVTMQFEKKELRNWVSTLISEDPERARLFLSDMLKTAISEENIRNATASDADMTARESEIVALLNIDKASLSVRRSNHNEHSALIKSETLCFTRVGHSRIDAVEAVWSIYREYMDQFIKNKNEQRWVTENMSANNEETTIRYIKDPDKWGKKRLALESKKRIHSK